MSDLWGFLAMLWKDTYLRFLAGMFFLWWLYDVWAYVPPQKPQGKRVWMVTDGRNHWVEGMYNSQGVAMTYEEIMEREEEWNNRIKQL